MKTIILLIAGFLMCAGNAYSFSPSFGNDYVIKSDKGVCLEVRSGLLNNNAIIQVNKCDGSKKQRWYFKYSTNESLGPDAYAIVSSNSNRCIDINNNKINNKGIQALQWGCHLGSNQQWEFARQGDGSYHIVNKASRLCLDIRGGSNLVQQYPCHTGSNQKWHMLDKRKIDTTFVSGDLAMLDYCYTAEKSGGVTIYPIIKNSGNNAWYSRKRGFVRFVVHTRNGGSIYTEKRVTIPGYPYMMITPDSTYRLPGTLLTDPTSRIDGFILVHDDDNNSKNNAVSVSVKTFDAIKKGELKNKLCR